MPLIPLKDGQNVTYAMWEEYTPYGLAHLLEILPEESTRILKVLFEGMDM